MSNPKVSQLNSNVIVFVHAPTRDFALKLVDKFAEVIDSIEIEYEIRCRFVSSSDDTKEGRIDDDRSVKR